MPLTNLKPPAVTGNLAKDLQTDADNLGLSTGGSINTGGSNATASLGTSLQTLLQQIYDKIKADGDAIIADMQKAQGIASTKLPDGSTADQPSANCLAAFIPVVQLIVDNQLTLTAQAASTTQPAQTPDGVVTAFVKMRVVINALQSPSVQSGCAWLQQSIQQAGTQGLAGVLGGILGITKLAPVVAAL